MTMALQSFCSDVTTLSQDVNNRHVCRLITVIVNIYLHYNRVYRLCHSEQLFALRSCIQILLYTIVICITVVYIDTTDSILYCWDRGYSLCIGTLAHLAEAGARSPPQKAGHNPWLISGTHSLLGGHRHGCKEIAQRFSLHPGNNYLYYSLVYKYCHREQLLFFYIKRVPAKGKK